MEAMRKVEKNRRCSYLGYISRYGNKKSFNDRTYGKRKLSEDIGFRNYWASTIKNLIDDIEKKKYKEWKLKYGS